MLTKAFAEHFANDWIRTWNNRDLSAILAHYTDDFVMSSPRIAVVAGESSGTLQGRQAIGAYWEKALAQAPDLRFDLVDTLIGADSLVIYFKRRYQGAVTLAAEVFFFNSAGLVFKAAAHYSSRA